MATIATVSPTELIRSTWGNSVATELNSNTVKVDGSKTMTSALIVNATSGIGLRLRGGTIPLLQFENSTGATRYGYIQGQPTQMIYYADTAASMHRFLVNGIEKLRVDNGGVDITGGFTVDAVTSNGRGRFGGDGQQLELIDTSTSGSDFHDCYLAYFGGGVSMVSPGTRTGFVGYASSTLLQVRNEIANGGVALITTGTTGNINVTAGGVITLSSGGVERGRVSGALLWGKTSGGIATPGVELFESGTIYSTTATNGVANMLIRHNTNANLAAFVQFQNASGGVLSQILQDDVAPVGISITNCTTSAPSDYRLKNDLGPVVGAVDRVSQLQPKHLSWKATGEEFDGFIAHELAAVVPNAVIGAKDATYEGDEAERMGVPPGTINAQQLNQDPLIPLLTAAVQELAERVAAIEDI